MSSLPLPPRRSTSSGSSYQQSPSSTPSSTKLVRGGSGGSNGGLPPPPNIAPQAKGGQTNYAQNLAKSMTIEEMRELHRRALSDAEAKQMELRLVLASRYRELVGSSDKVTKMRERAQELHELVHALPELMEKLVKSSSVATLEDIKSREDTKSNFEPSDHDKQVMLRHKLANLPRLVHRALDRNDVHGAAESLMELFRLIAEQTNEYPLATALATANGRGLVTCTPSNDMDKMLQAQMRMIFLHVQTLPDKITRISKHILNIAASYGEGEFDPKFGAERSASALSTLDILDITSNTDRSVHLLDLYFDSKAQLLQSLLNSLSTPSSALSPADTDTSNAGEILSKIVLILQYDIVLHPYQIFVLRRFPSSPTSLSSIEDIMKSLPMFSPSVVQTKVSKFLAAHLPLIRTKVKSVLVAIAGTTASALGKIRQALYDKTDGVECMERLDSNGICTWAEAVTNVVDIPSVLSGSYGAGNPATSAAGSSTDSVTGMDRKFSLWGVLFSNTFSSLVHSLLTSSFHSVHTKVVSTLRLSLANAPPLSALLPHEAYRNTLYIASELNTALLKVSDDAHELLVHAEDRVESETRLRQSLYVQTCEIMGRLICELRRMMLNPNRSGSDAVKDLIVGRLCHLLKFRLSALPTLLDPKSSPAVLQGTSGMISMLELSSAFDLADDNDDGLITFQEAIEAVDSAFSGTQFHGAEMVRETLLLPTTTVPDRSNPATAESEATPRDVTLHELTLLLARGLRHENEGVQSALGTIQEALDQIITTCFDRWAKEALSSLSKTLSTNVEQFVKIASTYSEIEYKRVYASSLSPSSSNDAAVGNVSLHLLDFLLEISFTLNRSVCPSDSLLPVPSPDYAKSVGIQSDDIPCLMDLIRWALLSQGLAASVSVLEEHVGKALNPSATISLRNCGPSALVQLKTDMSFVGKNFFRRNKHGFGRHEPAAKEAETSLRKVSKDVDALVRRSCDKSVLAKIEENHLHVMEVCDLFISSLLGQGETTPVPLGDIAATAVPTSGMNSLLHPPLTSSCRFPLLPIQSDRTLSGVQARGKYKEKDETESRQSTVGSGAMRAGLGLFSSLLKKT